MAFDPDKYLAGESQSAKGFDPDAYLASSGKIDFKGLQNDEANKRLAKNRVESDPLTISAKATSNETRFPRWLGGNPNATTAERIASSLPVSFAAGAASLPLGGMQLVSELGGDSALSKRLQQFSEMQRAGGVSGSGVAGFAGGVLSPVGLGVLKAMPMSQAQGILGTAARTGQGAGIGAGFGLLSPVTNGAENYTSDKVGQVGMGALLGGAVPLGIDTAIKGGDLLRHGYRGLIEPRFQSGRNMAEGRNYVTAAGERADEIASALGSAKPPVPGYSPTAAEIVAQLPKSTQTGQYEFAGLQKNVAPFMPGAQGVVTENQNKALAGHIRSFGGDEAALQNAIRDRANTAGPIYDAAKTTGSANTQPIIDKIDVLLEKNIGNREFVNELRNLRNGLLSENGPRTNTQQVSSVLDGLKTAIADEKNKFIHGNLKDLKDEIASSIPFYPLAQAAFKAKSVPVNQMQIGQELEKSLTNPLMDDLVLRPSAFASAIENATQIPKKLDMPRFTRIEDALLPQNMQKVNEVKGVLANRATAEEMGAKGSTMARKLVDTPEIVIPPTLSREGMVARFLARVVQDKNVSKIDKEMASDLLTNPSAVSEKMRSAMARAKTVDEVVKAMRQYSPLATQGILSEK